MAQNSEFISLRCGFERDALLAANGTGLAYSPARMLRAQEHRQGRGKAIRWLPLRAVAGDDDELPATDDRVRRDGGKPTDEAKVPIEELVKAARNARKRNTRDEPGS